MIMIEKNLSQIKDSRNIDNSNIKIEKPKN